MLKPFRTRKSVRRPVQSASFTVPGKRTSSLLKKPKRVIARRQSRIVSDVHPQAGVKHREFPRALHPDYFDRYDAARRFPKVLCQYLAVEELSRMRTRTADHFVNLAGMQFKREYIVAVIPLLQVIEKSNLHQRIKRTANRALRALERKTPR